MSGKLRGTFRSWKEPWGFIISPGSFQGDLFGHRDEFVTAAPQGDLTGQAVEFEREVDSKGRHHAARISLLGANGQPMAPSLAGVAPAMATPSGAGLALSPSGPSSAKGKGRKPTQVSNGLGGKGPVTAAILAGHLSPAGAAYAAESLGLPPAAGSGKGGVRANAQQMATLVGTRMRGEIRTWKKEWGFIICPAKFNGDLFCHRENLQFSDDPAPGKEVSFTVSIDQKGRCAAADVSEPTASPEDFIGQGAVVGQIRSWKKEWGFVTSPSFEGDLFCHTDSFETPIENEALEEMIGAAVNFEVTTDKRARPRATKVNIVGAPVPGKGLRTQGLTTEKTQEIYESEPMVGMIRSWRDPWGFIVCPEKFEGDLFVHRDSFTDVVPPEQDLAGAQVQFRRGEGKRGRPHAEDVRILGDLPEHGAVPGLNGDVIGSAEASQHTAKFSRVMGQRIEGKVRSWKNEWGFVVAPEHFEGDLFVHRDNLPEGGESLAVGARVSFEVAVDPKGRATASAVQGTMLPKEWAASGETLQGVIRSWKEPWGFVISPGNYSGDLFFHLERFQPPMRPEQIQTGMHVTFIVDTDKQGRVSCFNMRIIPTPIHGKRRNGGIGAEPPVKRHRTAHLQ